MRTTLFILIVSVILINSSVHSSTTPLANLSFAQWNQISFGIADGIFAKFNDMPQCSHHAWKFTNNLFLCYTSSNNLVTVFDWVNLLTQAGEWAYSGYNTIVTCLGPNSSEVVDYVLEQPVDFWTGFLATIMAATQASNMIHSYMNEQFFQTGYSSLSFGIETFRALRNFQVIA